MITDAVGFSFSLDNGWILFFCLNQGTSADQDTRFSNKMKKLLKSQKFAPELDVPVSVCSISVLPLDFCGQLCCMQVGANNPVGYFNPVSSSSYS